MLTNPIYSTIINIVKMADHCLIEFIVAGTIY